MNTHQQKLEELTEKISKLGIIEYEKIVRGEVRLADVLLAIEKVNPKREITDPDNVNFGEVVESGWYEKLYVVENWILPQNALHLQSEETINFLHELIV